MRTAATSTLSSVGSLSTTSLQQSLENRLQARMAAYGSPEYELRWSNWDMPLGVPICALRASVLRTSGKDYSGWRTGILAGWPSPTSSMITEQDLSQAMTAGNGKNRKPYSESGVIPAGWPTPTVQDGHNKASPSQRKRNSPSLNVMADQEIAGWNTPCAKDEKGNHSQCWAQPVKDIGLRMNGSPVETVNRGALNPAFACWLMGFPPAWCDCAVMATLLSQALRPSSFKQQRKRLPK